jgi:hypothetical protein
MFFFYREGYCGKRRTINAKGADFIELLKHRRCYFDANRPVIVSSGYVDLWIFQCRITR